MDHHCPWTNNCVAFYTLKPFLLFLMYVTLVSFFIVGCIYRAAWKYGMHHISILKLLPSSQFGQIIMLHMANEEERKKIIEENEKEFQRQMEA
eukprot:CAMPEP_0168610820 /NCGR_PEP_ID=MMETSP0449_2-20121227/2004_1 /TAXON_ID=1082188 /ORGANISM="Strombidium rassoulzadegani, Strain ras09" /LENGTH=92 /DNA_ID=CAMNT_0008651177 /DNA_START=502 /DNA_END=780 /DNA_ORIENTATION=+